MAERASEVITAARGKAGRTATKSKGASAKGRGKATSKKTSRLRKGTTPTSTKETEGQGTPDKPVTETVSDETKEDHQ